jgi:hypothetical protein
VTIIALTHLRTFTGYVAAFLAAEMLMLVVLVALPLQFFARRLKKR